MNSTESDWCVYVELPVKSGIGIDEIIDEGRMLSGNTLKISRW